MKYRVIQLATKVLEEYVAYSYMWTLIPVSIGDIPHHSWASELSAVNPIPIALWKITKVSSQTFTKRPLFCEFFYNVTRSSDNKWGSVNYLN